MTYQDAVITDNPQGIQSVGNHPQGAPAVLANLWTSYLFLIAGISGFHVGGGLNYQGKSSSDITNVNSIPPYLIANAAFGYDAKNWGLDVNVHNITNERYFLAANAAGANRSAPRLLFTRAFESCGGVFCLPRPLCGMALKAPIFERLRGVGPAKSRF